MNKLAIYQIYYLENQKNHIEGIPFCNLENPKPYLCEHAIFQNVYADQTFRSAEYTGFLSWRFGEKSKITVKEFERFILSNPGHDVYFVNPFPWSVAFFRNVWVQGERYHPQLLGLGQKILSGLGYEIDLNEVRFGSQISGFCNYWVANERFWVDFMKFCEPVYEILDSHTFFTEQERAKLWASGDAKYPQLPHHTFVLERMFSTFLHLNNHIRALKFPETPEYLSRHYGEYAKVIPAIYEIRESDKNLDESLISILELFQLKCRLS